MLGEGNGTPLQYSCLENPMGGGAWWATVNGEQVCFQGFSPFFFYCCWVTFINFGVLKQLAILLDHDVLILFTYGWKLCFLWTAYSCCCYC